MTCVEYQAKDLDRLRCSDLKPSKMKDVTVLAYYFRPRADLDRDFWRTEYALLKTFETQGVMPSVLVVNETAPGVLAFCSRYGIKIQKEPGLVPGQIKTLALDLISNLHTRFDTSYVLTVQDDGFPLRPGLEEFVGKYDYIGAPWVHHNTYYDLYPYRYCVGNGGFSLRSKRVCEAAAQYYKKFFKWMPYWWYVLGDDTFYCKTLRFWFPRFREKFAWAHPEMASKFSVECNADFLVDGEMPLGFHGVDGWRNYCKLSRMDK